MLPRTVKYLFDCLRRQWKSPEEISQYQFEKLRELLSFIQKHNYYYRTLFSRGIHFDSKDFSSLEDLGKIPPIDRKDVLSQYGNFISDPVQGSPFNAVLYKLVKTSGSTGHSFTILYDERCYDQYEAIYLRSFLGVGYNPFHKISFYWYEDFKKRIYNCVGLIRRCAILTNTPLEKQIAQLARLQSKMFYYFPSMLYLMARSFPKKAFTDIRPKVIKTHGEIITPAMRRRIEEAFECPVYDHYGTSEFDNMAWECPERKGYHINEDSILMEGIPFEDGKKGSKAQELLITGLHNYTFPLLRYRIGDVATLSRERCSCGRGLPLLKQIEGRREDFLRLPSGRILSPSTVIEAYDQIDEISAFQVNQHKPDEIEVVCVPRKEGDNVRRVVEDKTLELFDESVHCHINQVEEIPLTRRGKFKFVNGIPREYFT